MIKAISNDVRVQSLNSVTAGFGFATALAWLDLVRWFISSIVRVKANGGSYFLISAIFTTLISVMAVMVILRFGGPGLDRDQKPVFAVTR